MTKFRDWWLRQDGAVPQRRKSASQSNVFFLVLWCTLNASFQHNFFSMNQTINTDCFYKTACWSEFPPLVVAVFVVFQIYRNLLLVIQHDSIAAGPPSLGRRTCCRKHNRGAKLDASRVDPNRHLTWESTKPGIRIYSHPASCGKLEGVLRHQKCCILSFFVCAFISTMKCRYWSQQLKHDSHLSQLKQSLGDYRVLGPCSQAMT